MLKAGSQSGHPDPLSDVLATLSVTCSVFCLSELPAPWGFRVEGTASAKFHIILEGSACLTVPDHGTSSLREGDLVLLPSGNEHAISDAAASTVTELESLVQSYPLTDDRRLRWPGDGELTRLLCGAFSLGEKGTAGLLSYMPDVVHIDGRSTAAATWLSPILRSLEFEAEDGKLGARALQDKIAEVFVTQAVRSWLLAGEQSGLVIPALVSTDEIVAAAVSMLQGEIERGWTIDQLASAVALSRSSFVIRFRREMGESPMRYLTRLRMSRAAALLTTSQLSLYEIAQATGYGTEAALSKAFKRATGHSPGAYRSAARIPAPAMA
jgi:AraC-like DNA-binding protein